jgi:hypothetical protein
MEGENREPTTSNEPEYTSVSWDIIIPILFLLVFLILGYLTDGPLGIIYGLIGGILCWAPGCYLGGKIIENSKKKN